MVAAAGNRVAALHRFRVGRLALDPAALPAGRWRRLGAAEVRDGAGFDTADALGIRRYAARNRTMGAVRRRYAADGPRTGPTLRGPADAGEGTGPGGGGGGRGRAAVVDLVTAYLGAHGGRATVAALGNELGRRGIRFPGRLAPLLAAHARAAGTRAAFAVGPDLVVTLRPGRRAGTGGSGGSGDSDAQGAEAQGSPPAEGRGAA
jgi:hypothetical protein